MKNITTITKPTQKCTSCKQIGYYCLTPMGADYETCPLCGNCLLDEYDYGDDITNEEYDKIKKLNLRKHDNGFDLNYCTDCHVMIEVGCMHAAGGCTDNDYNGHVVCKWRDKTNDIIYNGMPHFESEQEWLDKVDDVQVLNMVCLSMEDEQHCTGKLCCYPKSKYPQFYSNCKYIDKEKYLS